MSENKVKITAGLEDAIRHARGEDVGARVTKYGTNGELVRNSVIEECAEKADETAARFDKLAGGTPEMKALLGDAAQGARHAAAEIRALKT